MKQVSMKAKIRQVTWVSGEKSCFVEYASRPADLTSHLGAFGVLPFSLLLQAGWKTANSSRGSCHDLFKKMNGASSSGQRARRSKWMRTDGLAVLAVVFMTAAADIHAG